MKSLYFLGKLPASGLLLPPILVAQDYEPTLHILGENDSERILRMKTGLARLHSGETVHVAHDEIALTLLAFRASRLAGVHVFEATAELLGMGAEDLIRVFRQLGVVAERSGSTLRIQSEGWKLHGDTLLIPSRSTLPLASAVLWNAWRLPFDLYVSLGGRAEAHGLWRPSLKMAQDLGVTLNFWDADFRIPKGQKLGVGIYAPEIDTLDAFALAAVAAVSGQATFLDFPSSTLQPTSHFVAILERMGIPIRLTAESLRIEKAPKLNAISVNLKSSPELIFSLVALCALSDGDSQLFGLSSLGQEDRTNLVGLGDWLKLLGRSVEILADEIRITGPVVQPRHIEVPFQCHLEPRLAFAAAVLRGAGWTFTLTGFEVVRESFPSFWDLLGWSPHVDV